MAKIKITKSKGSLLLEIPPELLAQLAEGETLGLEIPGQAAAAQAQKAEIKPKSLLSEDERAVLLRLNSIKFDKRVPAEVGRLLSAAEKSVLVRLIEKRLINVLKSRKYPSGVYNIPDNIYPELRRGEERKGSQPAQAQAQSQAPQLPSSPSQSPFSQLFSRGFAIVENEIDAKKLSDELSERIKNGDILGVRGFDKKFYVATKSFYLENEGKTLKALTKEGKDVEQLAAEIGVHADAAKILLALMADSGEIIEKRRGVFASA